MITYDKKYILDKIEELGSHNPIYEGMEGKICYLAYLKTGERGWFLCDTNDSFNPVHRIHTSEIQRTDYINDEKIIVTTQNTKFVFKPINK